MDHIGIDLGSRESQVCVRTAAGEMVEERRCRTTELGPWLMARVPARIILETCTEAFRLAGIAQRHGHDVRVVAATLVRSLGVGQRGLKNDVRDARILSEASCRIDLPSVHIPTVVSQEVKSICVSREALVRMRTQLVNRVRSYLARGWWATSAPRQRRSPAKCGRRCLPILRACRPTLTACSSCSKRSVSRLRPRMPS